MCQETHVKRLSLEVILLEPLSLRGFIANFYFYQKEIDWLTYLPLATDSEKNSIHVRNKLASQ